MKDLPFSRITVAVLLAVALGLFALSMILSAYDQTQASSGARHRPGSFSSSAIGYAGLYEVLKQMDRPVARAMGRSLSLTGSSGTLILAEPDLGRLDQGDQKLKAPRLLLVLPKWRGYASDDNPAWIGRADVLSVPTVQSTLALVDSGGEILRVQWPGLWSVNEIGLRPEGFGQVQLMRSARMRPIVALGRDLLVGEIKEGERRIWVVSDPDVLSNHGLLKGDNAAFAVALIDRLRALDNDNLRAPIVFDEAVHGFLESQDSFLKMMFRLPFVALTILICLAAALLAWSGSGRFGAPRSYRPPLDFGKRRLIDNSARLLDYAGHHAELLRRYIKMVVRSAAEALHAPAGLDLAAQADWLDRIGRSRGLERSCAAILQDSLAAGQNARDLSRLFEGAWNIYKWKGEIYGSAKSRGHN